MIGVVLLSIYKSGCVLGQESLTSILQKYCVPKNGSGCVPGVKAEYNEKKVGHTYWAGLFQGGYKTTYHIEPECSCGVRTKYYDITRDRICKDCIMGSFARENWIGCEPVNCPNGQYAKLISGNCPSGLYKKLITTTCPSGYGMQVWNYDTKKWTWR